MLGTNEWRKWIDHFGTPESQVRRDHLLSHVLLRLPELDAEVIFFGGTALCRTYLPDWRLSEDIDLLVERPNSLTDEIDRKLPRFLRREFPNVSIRWGRDGETAVGELSADDLNVRLQLIELDSSYRLYPSKETSVELRYEDLPRAVQLVCPTQDAAAAMKLNAWADRAASRDLCDLYGLVRADAIRPHGLELATRVSRPLQPYQFADDRLPTEAVWRAALGHQMREPPAREEALLSVRVAVSTIAGW